jgi:hypothetical protein
VLSDMSVVSWVMTPSSWVVSNVSEEPAAFLFRVEGLSLNFHLHESSNVVCFSVYAI